MFDFISPRVSFTVTIVGGFRRVDAVFLADWDETEWSAWGCCPA